MVFEKIIDELDKHNSNIEEEIDRLTRIRQLLAKNEYDGKYRDQFEDVYEDILEAKDTIEKEFEDGFQFSDLEDIIVAVSPVLRGIYTEFYGTLKDDKEGQTFLRDLVIFIYYEVEDKLKTWGLLKGILRLVVRLWLARKIAKYMKIAFDYADGKAINLTTKIELEIDKYLPFLK